MDGLQAHRLAEALLPLLREGLSGLPEALRALGEGLRAHRAYLFRLEEREGRWYASQLAEWAGVGATPQIQNPALQDLPMEEAGYGRWLRLFREDRAVAGPVRAFPESERPLLEAQEIQSLLVVPVRVDGALWGFLGVDDCQRERSFGPEEEAFLRTVAEALARVLDLFARHHSWTSSSSFPWTPPPSSSTSPGRRRSASPPTGASTPQAQASPEASSSGKGMWAKPPSPGKKWRWTTLAGSREATRSSPARRAC